ncbi:Ig-like domain repeat protein, partial [Bradyrhizobium manausense]|nr:Ig-like domain repeat protein [Bradyrhizobium manausense]
LADGSYSIKANVSDAAGNAAPTASQGIAVETVAPTVSISTTGATTNQATQTISGTVTAAAGEAAVGSTVKLFDTVNGVTGQVGTATVGSGGAWSTSVTLAGNGSNSIVAQDTDAAGNTGSSTAVNFTLATTAPTIAITSPVAGDNVINKTEAAAGVTITGTATAGSAAVNGQTATITIVDSSNTIKDTYTTTVSSGAWSVNVTAAQAQGLADGSYSIKANVSDAAGNAAPTASQAIVVDETAPTIAITSPVAGDNVINKTEAAAGVTITGTATAGSAAVNGQTATITIVDASNAIKDTYTTTVSSGTWSVNVTAAQAQGLADGSYSIKANVSDAAGNAAPTASQGIAVDETAPTIAITSPVAGDNVINKTEAAAGVTITGTATAGSAAVNGQTATITIVDASNTIKDTYTTTVSSGAWSVNVTAAQAQGLADGSYSIKANVLDAAGNAAPTASQAIVVDETAPTIAITSPVAGDNVINKTEAAAGVTITGTATAGSAAVNGQTATITIVDGSNAIKDSYTTTVSSGAWSVNVTAAQAQGLADGSYSIKANVLDAAGNAAPTASQAIVVDETAPTIAITSPVAGDNVINKTEAAAGVTITGTATAGSAAV